MKIKLYFFAILLLSFSKLHGQEENILTIEFKTGSRGWQQSITIRSDSTFINYTPRTNGEHKDKIIRTTTTLQEWSSLINSISKYILEDLTYLPSPTHVRDGDGAAYSDIKIITNIKEYNSGDFDNFNPNEKLTNLLKVILDIQKRKM